MATKSSAFGAKLLLSDGAPTPVYTEIPGVQDFGFPLGLVENEDVTSHDSPGRYREFIQTVRDAGEISATIMLDVNDVTHQALIEAGGQFGSQRLQFEAPTGETLAEVDAFVGMDATGAFPVTGAITASISIRPTGEVLLPFLTP
jgi:hypothetical protein